MKYKDWLTDWLELYVKPVVKIQTYEKYERNVKVHIVPALGYYELEQLRAEVLQRFIVYKTKTLSSNTVNGIITVLQKSLKTAVSLGICDAQFADKIIRPKAHEKKTECFTLVEQKKIEHAIFASKKHRLFGVVLCLYTGLRIGELLALKWSDVDLTKGVLSVNKSCHYGRNSKGEYGQIIDTPKTTQSIRTIPIPKQLISHLRILKKNADGEFVISWHGKPVNTRTYQYDFGVLLKRLNIPHRGFHSLRHTFATRALECGMDIKTLSEILGHKSAAITMNRYAHSLMEHKTEMMNKLGKLLQ